MHHWKDDEYINTILLIVGAITFQEGLCSDAAAASKTTPGMTLAEVPGHLLP